MGFESWKYLTSTPLVVWAIRFSHATPGWIAWTYPHSYDDCPPKLILNGMLDGWLSVLFASRRFDKLISRCFGHGRVHNAAGNATIATQKSAYVSAEVGWNKSSISRVYMLQGWEVQREAFVYLTAPIVGECTFVTCRLVVSATHLLSSFTFGLIR